MNTKSVNKRKLANEIKHPVEPKLRKTDNVETLTKQALVKKYKELEEQYKKVVSDCEKLKQENEALSNDIKILEKGVTKSVSETQTVMSDDFIFPCQICIHNADSEFDLRIHMEYVHDFNDGFYIPKIKCNVCKTKFKGKHDLMTHIKTNHRTSLPTCKHFQKGSCKFTEQSCWFVHKREEIPSMKCRYCEETFFSKSEVMIHQKTKHEEQIPICKNHVKGQCRFKSKCWYQHHEYINTNHENSNENSISDSDETNTSIHETSSEEYENIEC